MTDKTVSELITDIETELHLASGPGVQLYAQDALVARINAAYLMFFEDKEVTWKRFVDYATFTLDGATGTATVAVSSTFRDFEDIIAVYPEGSDRPLNRWNYRRNPTLIQGNYPQFIKPSDTADKVFEVLPASAAGTITVVGKKKSQDFPFNDLNDVVPFDYLAIVYFVAWQELTDDGSSPAAAQVMLQKFTNRMKQLAANQSQEGVSYSGGRTATPTQWFDSNA